MKLYATVTSERASKGQGGNKYIRMALNVGSAKDSREVATVTLIAVDGGGYEIFHWNKETDKTTCIQTGMTKGEKQKGETGCKKCGTMTMRDGNCGGCWMPQDLCSC